MSFNLIYRLKHKYVFVWSYRQSRSSIDFSKVERREEGVSVHHFQNRGCDLNTLNNLLLQEREVVVESAVTQDDLGLSGDDYDDSSKGAFEKFVSDIKVKFILIQSRQFRF